MSELFPAHHAPVPRHRAVLARVEPAIPEERRPTPGPIALLPHPTPLFEAAVRDAGGELGQLGGQTRGLVWLSSRRSDDLVKVLSENPQIEWVQLPWAGVDAFGEVLASYADSRFPLWTSAKGAYAQPVAEHALALALGLLRVFPTRIRATSWSSLKEGRSLYGLNVVIIGAGGIAVELARLLSPFGVRLTVVRRSAESFSGADITLTSDRLAEALPEADVVFVAAAMTSGTRRLIGAAEFAVMKGSAVLVNIARGALVDTDALVRALASEQIAGAGIDVTDPEPLPDGHPLWDEPKVIITPHSADTPEMTTPLLVERVKINVEAFLDHGRFVGVVDPKVGY